jgi:uncharacterized protein (DUF1330 family)
MVAYVIAIKEETLDPEGMKAYAVKGTAAFDGLDFTVRAAYGRTEYLEGGPAESVVILEFPTFEAAQNWYRSPIYQEAVALRLSCARFRLILVDGVAQPP